MLASACLRILLDLSDDKMAKLDAIGRLVSKVADSFLCSRWPAPKRYSILTPYSFVLTDPCASEIDVGRLEQMAAELKLKLFGDSPTGDVTLLLHEGDEVDTARLAAMDQASLKRLLSDPSRVKAAGGRMLVMSTAEAGGGKMRWQPIEDCNRFQLRTVGASRTVFQGVYLPIGERFVGSAVLSTPDTEPGDFSIFDNDDRLPGERAEAFDLASIDAAAETLVGRPLNGVLFVPVSFSSVTRAAARDAYLGAFRALPRTRRSQLIALVYGVPLMPSERSFAALKAMLDPVFGEIELQVASPGFDVDRIPPGSINTLTLRLPSADPILRGMALRRFLENKPAFKRRQIRPAITNVRDREDIRACANQPIVYFSGPAICAPMLRPIRPQVIGPRHLPLPAEAA